jgi:hypothetical protein
MPKGVRKQQQRKPAKKTAIRKPARKIDKPNEIAVRRTVTVNEESKALFLDHHLPKIAQLKDRQAKALSDLRNAYKTAKKDGFLQRDFDIAFKLRTQTGEKEIKATIARDLTIAQWLGYSGLGKQLDLFVEEDKPEDVEALAYAAGEMASRANQPAKPMYAPDTPGYEAYMHGFHDHQETIAQGIKKIEPAIPPPTSGVVMTRSQFKAQQRKKNTQQAADAAEERSSLFQKRDPSQPESAA